MSGPKGIRYEIARERGLVTEATRRWRVLAGRARAHGARCAALGLADPIPLPQRAPSGTSAELQAACDRLERAIDAARKQLDTTLAEQRSRRVAYDLGAALAALTERERASAQPGDRPAADARPELSERIERLLATLLEPSAALTEAAHRILTSDPARARLLLSDLDVRIKAANERTVALGADRAALADLVAEAEDLTDDTRIRPHLRAAAQAVDEGRSAAALLAAARAALVRQREREQAASDRGFVLAAVRAAFGDLGYTAVEVELATPHTILLRRTAADAYAVRVAVGEGEIDLRTVRGTADTDRAADTAADRSLCADVEGVLTGLRERGVLPGRVRAAPPGVVVPGVVALPAPKAAVRRARTRERER